MLPTRSTLASFVVGFSLLTSIAAASPSGPVAIALSNVPAVRAAAVSGVAPVLLKPSDMILTAGETADQTLHAIDADGDALTFSKAFGPTYMTVTTTDPGAGTATGNVHLAPGQTDTGMATAGVAVTDGLFADQASFQIRTLGPGVAPVLTQPLDMTVGEGESLPQTLHASDANGDPLDFYLASGPAYAAVTTLDPGAGTGVGQIVVSPGFGSHGTASATVGVTDGVLTDERSFSIVVTRVNSAPVLAQPSNMSVRVGEIKDQALSATDPNSDPVIFSKLSGPVYVTITTVDAVAGTGNVHVNPGDVGTQAVTVLVTDGDLSDQKSFVVTARADVAPILNQPFPMIVLAGTTAFQVLFASDSDGDPLEFSKVAGPAYMTVTTGFNTIGAVGILQLAPAAGDVGVTSGTVRVSDGLLGDDKTVSIEIVSDPPNSPFPVNDTGTYETGIQGSDASTPGAECPPPLGMTGGLSLEWVGDDSGDFNVYSVLSFDTKPWTRGSTFSLHVQEWFRVGEPFSSLGTGVILEYLRSSNPIPDRFVNTAEVEGSYNLFGLVSEADLFATGGVDLTNLINGLLQSPGPRYLYLRFRFPRCTDGDHVNDQIVFYSGGRAGESRATRIVETRTPTIAVELDPNIINLKSHGPWVTAYIEPSGFGPASIEISTLRLAGSVPPAPKFGIVGDHNSNGLPDLLVKFSREALDPLLTLGANSLAVTGSLVTGESFAGTGQVRVISNGGGPQDASVAPNPLNPSGVLTFSTVKPGRMKVAMFDLQGRLVRTLMETPHLPAGEHTVRIDGRGEQGEELPSGVYFYQVDSPDGIVTGRVAVLK